MTFSIWNSVATYYYLLTVFWEKYLFYFSDSTLYLFLLLSSNSWCYDYIFNAGNAHYLYQYHIYWKIKVPNMTRVVSLTYTAIICKAARESCDSFQTYKNQDWLKWCGSSKQVIFFNKIFIIKWYGSNGLEMIGLKRNFIRHMNR